MCRQVDCGQLTLIDAESFGDVCSAGAADSHGSPLRDPNSYCSPAGSTCIFFARVPPTVPYDVLLRLFSEYGAVEDLNLYRRWATAKTSKGCGTVRFSRAQDARAAMSALNGAVTFGAYPGCEGPWVVEWMDPAKMNPPTATGTKPRKAANSCMSSKNMASANNPSASSSSSSSKLPAMHRVQQLTKLHPSVAAAAAAAATTFNHGPRQNSAELGFHTSMDMFGRAVADQLQAQSVAANSDSALSGNWAWGSGFPVHMMPMIRTDAQIRTTQEIPGVQQLPTMSHTPPGPAQAQPPSSAVRTMSVPLETLGWDLLLTTQTNSLSNHPAAPEPAWLDTTLLSSVGCCASSQGLASAGSQLPAGMPQTQGVLQSLLLGEDTWLTDNNLYSPATISTSTAGSPMTGIYSPFASASALPTTQGETAVAGTAGTSCISSCSNVIGLDDTTLSTWAAGVSGTAGVPAALWAAGLMAQREGSCLPVLPASRMSSSESSLVPPVASLVQGSSLAEVVNRKGLCAAESARHELQVMALSDAFLMQLAQHMPELTKLSGAEFKLTAASEGMKLAVQGTVSQVDAAGRLLHMMGICGP